MDIRRMLRHLFMPHWRARTLFPARTLRVIETAIRECEATHAGEIRFAVEGALHPLTLFRNQLARERALDMFSQLRVWDTAHNNGILIYILLADRIVEIVADRGINSHVKQEEWDKICRDIEVSFRMGEFEEGVISGIRQIGMHLTQHYPTQRNNKNELTDKPTLM